jgi:hypothetical protein
MPRGNFKKKQKTGKWLRRLKPARGINAALQND